MEYSVEPTLRYSKDRCRDDAHPPLGGEWFLCFGFSYNFSSISPSVEDTSDSISIINSGSGFFRLLLKISCKKNASRKLIRETFLLQNDQFN